jgi:hypothetical protein
VLKIVVVMVVVVIETLIAVLKIVVVCGDGYKNINFCTDYVEKE